MLKVTAGAKHHYFKDYSHISFSAILSSLPSALPKLPSPNLSAG